MGERGKDTGGSGGGGVVLLSGLGSLRLLVSDAIRERGVLAALAFSMGRPSFWLRCVSRHRRKKRTNTRASILRWRRSLGLGTRNGSATSARWSRFCSMSAWGVFDMGQHQQLAKIKNLMTAKTRPQSADYDAQ